MFFAHAAVSQQQQQQQQQQQTCFIVFRSYISSCRFSCLRASSHYCSEEEVKANRPALSFTKGTAATTKLSFLASMSEQIDCVHEKRYLRIKVEK
jgi:hypothetical protein